MPENEGPREEVCDLLDNDCDGRIDEGLRNACGRCGVLPPDRCNGVDDDCDGLTDEDSECPGRCVDRCRVVDCPSCGEVGCPGSTLCSDGACIPRHCEGVECGPSERCFAGECRPTCAELVCPEDRVCLDGRCQADPCKVVLCGPNERCDAVCIGGDCRSRCLGDWLAPGLEGPLPTHGSARCEEVGCGCRIGAPVGWGPLLGWLARR